MSKLSVQTNKTILYFLLFTLSKLVAQEENLLDHIAVTVGEEIILNSDVINTLEEFNKTLNTEDESLKINECSVLKDLVSETIYINAAKKDSTISVKSSEVNSLVDNQVNYFVEQMGTLDKVLTFYKAESEDLLRKELFSLNKNSKLSQEIKRKIVRDVQITPDEIHDFFKKSLPNVPTIGASLEILQLVIHVKASEREKDKTLKKLSKIRDDILAGASFSTKAILYSQDPGSSSKGGLYTISKQTPFAKEFKKVAFSLDEGEVSKPFETDFGYHILKVDKILGTQRKVRHILLIPRIGTDMVIATKQAIIAIKEEIASGKVTFEEAILRYSEEKETKENKGYLINPVTQSTRFELTDLSPELHNQVTTLKSNQVSDILFERNQASKSQYKLMMVKNKREEHQANFSEDYEKIRELALANKKQKMISDWLKKEAQQTTISVTSDRYNYCDLSI